MRNSDLYKYAAKKLIEDNCLIFDTETTGLAEDDEIVELGIIDSQGNVLYSSLFKPEKEPNPVAARISGLTMEKLEDAPFFKDEFRKICSIMAYRPVMAFNTQFDERLFRQTAARYGLDVSMVNAALFEVFDAQQIYDQYVGVNRCKLEIACEAEGLSFVQDHRAVGDCKMTLSLLERVADTKTSPNVEKYIEAKAKIMEISVGEARSVNKGGSIRKTQETGGFNQSRVNTPSYLDLFREGKSVPEIAKIKGVRTSTVESNIVSLYSKGMIPDVDSFVQEEYADVIVKAITDPEWDGKLTPIKQQLPDDCTWVCIRAVIAQVEKGDRKSFEKGSEPPSVDGLAELVGNGLVAFNDAPAMSFEAETRAVVR